MNDGDVFLIETGMKNCKHTDSCKIGGKDRNQEHCDPSNKQSGILLNQETDDTAEDDISSEHEQSASKHDSENTAEEPRC